MAFRSIGELAGTVLQNAKTAAHADKLRMNLGGDEPNAWEETCVDPSPIASTAGGQTGGNGMKRTDAETSASFNGSRVDSGRTNTPLTMSRSMATVYSTAPHRESFPRSAVVIDLCMWKQVHRPPAHAARSGSAIASRNSAAAITVSLFSESEFI